MKNNTENLLESLSKKILPYSLYFNKNTVRRGFQGMPVDPATMIIILIIYFFANNFFKGFSEELGKLSASGILKIFSNKKEKNEIPTTKELNKVVETLDDIKKAINEQKIQLDSKKWNDFSIHVKADFKVLLREQGLPERFINELTEEMYVEIEKSIK